MKSKISYLVMLTVLTTIVVGCGTSKKEKELQNRIAQLEQQMAAAQPPAPNTNSTAEEPEVKPEGPIPAFEFPVESYDFGTITEGDEVEQVFRFKNVGEAPLIISSAKASCGCTVPKWPQEPIPIGGEGEILVKFNSKGKPGIQNKTVTITANTYPKISRLTIKANVTKKEENPS